MMASRAPRIRVDVNYNQGEEVYCNLTPNQGERDAILIPNQVNVVGYNLTSNKARHSSNIKFVLHICTFVEDDEGGLAEKRSSMRSWGLAESEFGSDRHRNKVADRLLEDGWLDQANLYITLDRAFSEANSSLAEEKENRSANEFGGGKIIIIFRVEKVVRKDDGDCIICMEKMVSSKTEVVTCMQCYHIFHRDCIQKWLDASQGCPLCKFCPLCRLQMSTN